MSGLNTVCIYWNSEDQKCIANMHTLEENISCFNDGNCDGSGTCYDCSYFDVTGLKFGRLGAGFYYDQYPMSLRIIYLRAVFRKCCHWSGEPIYLYPEQEQDEEGNYSTVIKPTTTTEYCSLNSPWAIANSDENPTKFTCNGAQPGCPYYTGPLWKYCTNDKLVKGNKISAAQILELRFYSRDWFNVDNPYKEWEDSFVDPSIFAWSGDYEFDLEDASADSETNAPMLIKVSPTSLYLSEFFYSTSAPIPAQKGITSYLSVEGDSLYGEDPLTPVPDYPTLIEELNTVTPTMRVLWPITKLNKPFVLHTFQIGQEYLWIVVYVLNKSQLYAVNLTDYPQGSTSDSDFLYNMRRDNPDGLFSTELSLDAEGLVCIPVKLSHKDSWNYGYINKIRLYLLKNVTAAQDQGSDLIYDSDSGAFYEDYVPLVNEDEYETADVYVKHIFHHAQVVQMRGIDHGGVKSSTPVVTAFSDLEAEATIWDLTNNIYTSQILWDSHYKGKSTIYAIEELKQEDNVSCTPLDCRYAILELSDIDCNSILPWELEGKCQGVTLGILVDRSANTGDIYTNMLPLEVVYKGGLNRYLPGNVVLVKIPDSFVYDPPLNKLDVVSCVFSATKYKQCPVSFEDRFKLKYPDQLDNYADDLAVKIEYESGNFKVNGPVTLITNGEEVKTLSARRVEEYKKRISDLLEINEQLSIESFQNGGVLDQYIKTHKQIFQDVKKEFSSEFSGYVFYDTLEQVDLSNAVDRLASLGADDGSYRFLVFFTDDGGRVVGFKRVYFIFQSAIVQTRDVEVFYKWRTQRRYWQIRDQYFCLADFSEPMLPGSPNGVKVYSPKCGDHSHQIGDTTVFSQHSYGTPGPMWYPYSSCLMPRYNQRRPDPVTCQALVEGFSNTGDLFGKRFGYWEKMRGPDIFESFYVGPVIGLGCFWGSRDDNWQSSGEQSFRGYTKVRSCHPNGPYATDRESLRISRHFVKQNANYYKQEQIREDEPILSDLSDEYQQVLLDGGGVLNSSSSLPIWTHINDDVVEVSLTTTVGQHPFAHLLLVRDSYKYLNEQFHTDRYSLSDVFEERDLTAEYSSQEAPRAFDFSMLEGLSDIGDIIKVFKQNDVLWAWLEYPKDPIRGFEGKKIGGISLYSPVTAAWKTNMESAVYMEDGYYFFRYFAPTFSSDGSYTNPYIQLDEGPPISIDWVTGEYEFPPVYDEALHEAVATGDQPFKLFGGGSDGKNFIADSSGVHLYVRGSSSEEIFYGRTFRGLVLSNTVVVDELPFELRDFFTVNPTEKNKVIGLKLSGAEDIYKECPTCDGSGTDPLVPSKDCGECGGSGQVLFSDSQKTFNFSLKGLYFVETVEITYHFGSSFDIPSISVFSDDNLCSKHSYIRSGIKVLGTKRKVYSVFSKGTTLTVQVGHTQSDRYSAIKDIKVWYRYPVDVAEKIQIFNRKINVSTGDTGLTNYSDLLYNYSRTYWDTGSVLGQDNASSFKRLSRNIKDIIVNFEFYDPDGVRFDSYLDPTVHPSNIEDYTVDSDGVGHIPGPFTVHTKANTVIAGKHKTDVMGEYISKDEDSPIGLKTGEFKLVEGAQEQLYKEASELTHDNLETVYNWFWHPDELSFFEDIVGIYDFSTKFSNQLVLKSTIIPLYKIWMGDYFGASENLSSPYGDGKAHRIAKWQGLGHFIYAGDPLFNERCWAVILFKKHKHIGEETYGTEEYKNFKLNPEFPWETIKDREYFLTRGLIQKRSTYWGGSIGGPGMNPLDYAAGFDAATVGTQLHAYRDAVDADARNKINMDPSVDSEDS